MELDFAAYETLTPDVQRELDEIRRSTFEILYDHPIGLEATDILSALTNRYELDPRSLYNPSNAPLRPFNVVAFGQLLNQPVMQDQIGTDRIQQNGTQRDVFYAIPPTNRKEFELRRQSMIERQRQREAQLRRASINFMMQYTPTEEEKRRNDAVAREIIRKQKAEARKRSSGMATNSDSSSTRRSAQTVPATVLDPFADRPRSVANTGPTPLQSARSAAPAAQRQQQPETGHGNDQTVAAASCDNASQTEINRMRWIIEGLVRDVESHALEEEELCRRLKISESTALAFFHRQRPRVVQFILEHCQKTIDHAEFDNKWYFAWKTTPRSGG